MILGRVRDPESFGIARLARVRSPEAAAGRCRARDAMASVTKFQRYRSPAESLKVAPSSPMIALRVATHPHAAGCSLPPRDVGAMAGGESLIDLALATPL